MKLIKKAVAVALVAVMAMTILAGCAKNEAEAPNPDEVVMVVGETEVKMNIANFFVRYNQSLMESVYTQYIGEDVWKTEMEDGVTYEENLKESLLEELQKLYIINSHAADYDVVLTDDEVKAVEAAADCFIAENTDEKTQSVVSGDRDTGIEYLKLHTISLKVEDAVKATVDTTVTDEDAAQKRARYFEISKSETLDDGSTMEMSDEEIKAAKKEAKEFLEGAKANGSMEAYATAQSKTTQTLTFNSESTTLDEEVIKAADELKVNEFSKVIESENGIYVLQLESEFDAEATETAKGTILTERQNEAYEDVLEKWTEETKITVHEKVWDKISVQGLKVNYIQDEVEEDSEASETAE